MTQVIGKDFIGTSAGCVIFNEEGKIFLAKRGASARDDQGKREFPGGTIQFYESRENAAKRNVERKYGFKISIDSLLGVYDIIDSKEEDHRISTTYIGKIIGGEPRILQPKKCDEIGWFSIEEIRSLPISRISKRNFNDIIQR